MVWIHWGIVWPLVTEMWYRLDMGCIDGVLSEKLLVECVLDWTSDVVFRYCTGMGNRDEVDTTTAYFQCSTLSVQLMSSLQPIFTTHNLTVPHLYSMYPACIPHILQPISRQYPFFTLHFQSVCTHFTANAQTICTACLVYILSLQSMSWQLLIST